LQKKLFGKVFLVAINVFYNVICKVMLL